MSAARRQLNAPRVLGLNKTAACRILPLCFGRQYLAGPSGVRFGVAVRNVHNGVVVETADRTALAAGATPVRTELKTPPVRKIAKVDGMIGRAEDQRTCLQHVRQCARIIL